MGTVSKVSNRQIRKAVNTQAQVVESHQERLSDAIDRRIADTVTDQLGFVEFVSPLMAKTSKASTDG